MAATAGGTPARRTTGNGTRKASSRKAAPARRAMQVPNPPPPLEETFRRGPGGNGTQPDTEADVVMLPGGFSFEPIRFEEEDAPEKIRVPLFYGPDGTAYTVWANPPPNLSLTYVDEFAKRGGDPTADAVATHWLLDQLIGEDGIAALLSMRSLDGARYGQIIAILNRIAMGPLEIPKDAGNA